MLAIQNAKTPTLVIHSQRDYRLDVSEGFQLFTALQRLNVPSKMLYFPDEGHWVLKPQNSKLWYETVGDWCDRWTKTNLYAAVAVNKAAPGAGATKESTQRRSGWIAPARWCFGWARLRFGGVVAAFAPQCGGDPTCKVWEEQTLRLR